MGGRYCCRCADVLCFSTGHLYLGAWASYLFWIYKSDPMSWKDRVILFTYPLALFFAFNAMCVGRYFLSPEFWQNYSEQLRCPAARGFRRFPDFSVLLADPFTVFYFPGCACPFFIFNDNSLGLKGEFSGFRHPSGHDLYPFRLRGHGLSAIYIPDGFIGIVPPCHLICQCAGTLVKHVPVESFSLGRRRRGLFCLAHNDRGLAYPNLLNRSKNPNIDLSLTHRSYFNSDAIGYPAALKLPVNALGQTDEDLRTEKDFGSDQELVEYTQGLFHFKQEAALIDSLISPNGRAAVIIAGKR